MLVAVNGLAVTVTVNNSQSFSYAFAPRIDRRVPSNLNWGYVGFGSDNARGFLDNIQVKVLERPFTLQTTDDFADGVANLFTGDQTGTWQVSARPLRRRDSGGAIRRCRWSTSACRSGIQANAAHRARDDAAGRAASAGFVFDLYSATDFKFVLVDAAADRVVIGHRSKKGWAVDAAVARVFDAGRDYDWLISLAGTTVSVMVDGHAVVGGASSTRSSSTEVRHLDATAARRASTSSRSGRATRRSATQTPESLVAATAPTASSAERLVAEASSRRSSPPRRPAGRR